VITYIKHISLLKIKSFLQKKYLDERLTINQIAVLTMSSRSTVIRHLRKAEIPIRNEEHRLGRLAYGERKVNGHIVTHQKEMELMSKIKGLKNQGLSNQNIADLLQGLNLPTKRGGQWSRRAIHSILKSME